LLRGLFVLFTAAALALGFVKSERYFGLLLHGWDAQFYYAAARSMVYDKDLDITNDLRLSPSQAPFVEAGRSTLPTSADGRVVNKYPLGLSLIEAPLVWMASAIPSGAAPGGYSPAQIRVVGAGLLVIALLGVLLTERWVALHVAAAGTRMIAVLLVLFGTSQYYYAAIFPFMTHSATVAPVCVLLVAAERWLRQPYHLLPPLLASLSTFALVLMRPQQALLPVLLLAVLAGHLRGKAWRASLFASGISLGAGTAIVLQCLAHKSGAGIFAFNVYSAGGEGFDLLRPDFFTVLASGGRGALFVSPLVALAAYGWTRMQRPPLIPRVAIAHAIMQVWLVASWSSPEQGDAFGARMLTELAPVWSLGLAVLVSETHRYYRGALIACSCVLAGWTQLCLAVYVSSGIAPDATHGTVVGRVLEMVR